MRNHIIVCGMGQVGYRVVDLLLRLGEEVEVLTMTTPHAEWLDEVQERGVHVRMGDARDERLVKAAGLAEARALIAATDQDLVNIEIALDAVRNRPDLTVVVRLFDQGMAKHLEASFDIRRALGMSSLAAPTFAAASLGEQGTATFDAAPHAFVIGRLKVSEASDFADATVASLGEQYRLFVVTHEVAGSGQASLPNPDVRLQIGDKVVLVAEKHAWDRHFGPLVSTDWKRRLQELAAALNPVTFVGYLWQIWSEAPLSIRSVFLVFNALLLISIFVFHHALNLRFVDALYFVVTTVTTVGYGDITLHDASDGLKLYGCLVMLMGSATIATLFSIVTDFVVTARFQALLGQQRIPNRDHVILVGVGNLGFHTAEELARQGVAVVAIDRDSNRDFVEDLRLRLPVLVGDGRTSSVLSRAGVERASALIATTSNDLMNLAVALAAKQINPRIRTVVRLFDPEFASKVQNILNVDVAQSDSRIAAPTFVAAALLAGVQAAFIRGTTMFMVVHRRIGNEWAGQTPSALWNHHQLRITLRLQQGQSHYGVVGPDEPLAATDQIVGVAQRELRP